jgi:TonB family protein
MNSRAVIAMFVVMLPVSCRAQSIGEQGLPLCDISKPDKASVNVITDTNGVDFGPYLEIAKRRVRAGWYSLVPKVGMFKSGCVGIQFKILQGGKIADIQYKSTSGDIQLDRAARGGVVGADPLPPLPAGFKGDHLDLRFDFFYNFQPEPTPKVDEAALAPSTPVHGSTQDFARIADSVNLAYLNALSTSSDAPSANPSDDSQIVPGRLVHKVDPKYPKEARKQNLEGTVVLQVTVEKNGNVTDIAILSGDLILADSAVDAVSTWRFEPYTRSGTPIQAAQKLSFNFVLGEKIGKFDTRLSPPTSATSWSTVAQNELPSDGKVYRVGPGITPPRAIYAPSPEYSEAARKIKFQGTCVLSLIVGPDGQVRDIKVIRALGKGLDAEAVEAVSKWKFQPATRDGEAVAVLIDVETQFHLY